jgi:hypothetical protein
LLVAAAPGLSSPASATTSAPYELYCPGTPVGDIVINDVVTSGDISPSAPASGDQFSVTNFQTALTIPSSLASAAAALGSRFIKGTATSTINASGATPSSVFRSALRFHTRIPSPVPEAGVLIHFPVRKGQIGDFTATGGPITISQGGPTTLRWEVAGSTLTLACTAYPNDSEQSGITDTGPTTNPISPVIASASMPFAITTTALPGATVGHEYLTRLTASGGNPPYLWKVVKGTSVPKGLRLSTSGVVSGVPTTSGTSTISLEALDTKPTVKPHARNVATKVLSITIS